MAGMNRKAWIVAGAAAAALGAGWAAVGATSHHHAMGAEPVAHERYVSFKSVHRHRAWLKPSVDLSDRFPTPGDQEWQSSCVAWATGYAARSFLGAEQAGRAPEARTDLVSPAYIFYRVRERKDICVGTGSNVAAALELLASEGSVSQAEMPYGTMTCKTAPTETQIASAAHWRIGGWRAIQRETPGDWRTPIVLDDVKAQLQEGLPVIFTMTAPQSFEDWKGGGVYSTDESKGGMHAMTLVGYDEQKQAFRLINSWGKYWGDGGYAWLSYATFARLVQEAYVMEPPAAPTTAPVAPPLSTDEQLSKVAGELQCGRVSVRKSEAGREMVGFTGMKDGYDEARTTALAADPSLKWNVAFHPWPQCEAELTLDHPLADGATRMILRTGDGGALTGDPVSMKADDLFSVEVATTPQRPYVHVVYLQADGSAVELYRGTPMASADGTLKVNLGAAGKRENRFQVAPPYGDEILIAVASDAPLFGDELSGHHTERQFLTMLRTSLAQAAREGRPVSAAVQRVRTAG